MLKSFLVFLILVSSGLTRAQTSNPVDVIRGSCEDWNPGYDNSCQTCPKRNSKNECVGSEGCNVWARSVCKSWKRWCNKYVLNASHKGEGLEKSFYPYVKQCRLYNVGAAHFQTILTAKEITKGSSNTVTPDPTNKPVDGPGKHVSGQSGTVGSGAGFNGFGDFCERSQEWCPEDKALPDELSDHVARKELKKYLYTKGVERILEGMRKFENDMKIIGADRPSERMLDQACCSRLHKNDFTGCLEGTSSYDGDVGRDTGLGDDWLPEFCQGRTSACEAGKAPLTSVDGLDVRATKDKLNAYAQELKNHIAGMNEVYKKMPLKYRYFESKECSEELTPGQAKIGNSKCETKSLTLAEAAASIRKNNDQDPLAQKFLNHFEEYSARHRMMGTTPYVLLLTNELRPVFTGKNAKTMNGLNEAAGKMHVSFDDVKTAIKSFTNDVGGKAICSLKRLYSGRVKGDEDLNGLDDCTKGSDENRAILASILKNPGALEEIVYSGKTPANLSLSQVNRIACGIQRQTKDCQEMWKSWEPHLKVLKGAGTVLKLAGAPIVPYIAIPYFYAESAIEAANAVSEYNKASVREEQILASVLKDEMDKEEFMVELDQREQKISGAKLGLLLAAAGAAGDVFDAGKLVYLRIHGSEANKLTLLNLADAGDEKALMDFVKKNPTLKIEVSSKPFKPSPPNKKKKKAKKKGKK